MCRCVDPGGSENEDRFWPLDQICCVNHTGDFGRDQASQAWVERYVPGWLTATTMDGQRRLKRRLLGARLIVSLRKPSLTRRSYRASLHKTQLS